MASDFTLKSFSRQASNAKQDPAIKTPLKLSYKLGLLVPERVMRNIFDYFNEGFLKAYLDGAQGLGLKLYMFSVKDINIKERKVGGVVGNELLAIEEFPIPRVNINLTLRHRGKEKRQLYQVFEEIPDLKVINKTNIFVIDTLNEILISQPLFCDLVTRVKPFDKEIFLEELCEGKDIVIRSRTGELLHTFKLIKSMNGEQQAFQWNWFTHNLSLTLLESELLKVIDTLSKKGNYRMQGAYNLIEPGGRPTELWANLYLSYKGDWIVSEVSRETGKPIVSGSMELAVYKVREISPRIMKWFMGFLPDNSAVVLKFLVDLNGNIYFSNLNGLAFGLFGLEQKETGFKKMVISQLMFAKSMLTGEESDADNI